MDVRVEQMKAIVEGSWNCWENNGQASSDRPCQIKGTCLRFKKNTSLDQAETHPNDHLG